MIRKPQYYNVDDFFDGLALVRIHPSANKWLFGFIDMSGKYAIEPVYFPASSFSEGLACVRQDHDGMGYIDTTGAWVIQPQFDEADSFSEGLAAVRPLQGARFGYIDKTGTWVIQPRFSEAGPFADDVAVAGIPRPGAAFHSEEPFPRLYGYIDKTGAWLVPPRYVYAEPFSHGLAHIRLMDADGYIDRSGRLVFSQPWQPTMGGK